MGSNIKDFNSWKKLNESGSFIDWAGSLLTTAFTGGSAEPAATPTNPTTEEPSKSSSTPDEETVGSLIKKATDKIGITEPDKKEKSGSAKSSKFKKFDKQIPAENVVALEAAMDRHGITNPFARKAILGVISKEGPNLQPEGDYSQTPNSRIREVYGERVADLSDAELTSLKNDPNEFWDRVYGYSDPTGKGQKYGNVNPGDGARYRGRGFNQITFKSNYEKLQKLYDTIGKLEGESDINIVKHPDQLEDPNIAAEFAVLYFINSFNSRHKDLNDYNSLESAVKDYVQANAGWGSDITSGHRATGLERALDYAKNIA